MSPAPPPRISDYLVLPVKLPATAIVPEATHYLYLRRHEPKLPGPDDARSLFAVNVPIDATAAHFRALFTSIGGGRVDDVVFENATKTAPVVTATKKRKRDGGSGGGGEGKEVRVWDRETRRSGSTAVIVFVDKASREVTLKAVAKRAAGRRKSGGLVWGEGIGESVKIPALGISRYLTHHNLRYPAKPLLQESVDEYMAGFAEEEIARSRAMAKKRQEPDEDGFITVVRGGRVAPARQEEAEAVLEKKKEKGAHEGFYRFQAREQRKNRQMLLLAKFEEDKKKVAARKSLRKFKPL